MSVQPIDLQNLFLRVEQIGKDNAAQQEAVKQQQAAVGHQIAQHSEEEERHVGSSSEITEGPSVVNSHDEEKKQSQSQSDSEKKKHSEESEIVEDPNIGQNIDVVG